MNFPASIKVKDISRTASEYDLYRETWQTVGDLNTGGAVLKEAVIRRGLYLLSKPREQKEVFATRQQRFSYNPLLTNISGWYQSALFKVPAQLVKKKKGVEGEAALNIDQRAADFCLRFEKDCDRAGCTFLDFWKPVFESLILNRRAYVLIDLPEPGGDDRPVSLADQEQKGLLDPFLVLYTPSQVINWETDRYGNLEWCIVAVSIEEREPLAAPATVDYWYYFDRDQVDCYSAVRKDQASDNDMATRVEGYPRKHAMSDLRQIPVRKIEVPDGLWLANRVFLQLLNHLNMDNAYDFGLFQSALAQLVIKGDYRETAMLSEVSYINIPVDGDISYLEPEGRAYEAIDRRLHSLEERIYRACYLLDQARTNRATPAAQSGISKEQDKTPSRDALSAFGAILRASMQLVYQDVLAIGEFKDIVPDVRGLDFEDKAGAEDLDFMEKSTVIDVQSDTYRKERDKKFVRIVLPDANPETLDKIDEEISTNPTPEAAAQLQAEQERAAQLDKFSASMKQADQIPA